MTEPRRDGPGRDRLRRWTESPLPDDRARAAVAAAERLEPGNPVLDEVLSKLADDDVATVRQVAAGALSRAMRRATGLARLQLMADWVRRPNARHRLAIARALRRRPTLVGAPSALETLAKDDDEAVRAAAYRAAARRPRWFHRLLRRGNRDRAPLARRAARRAGSGNR